MGTHESKTGGVRGPAGGDGAERAPGEEPGADRDGPKRRETQPLFRSEYWQRYCRPTPPQVTDVAAEPGKRASSSAEIDLVGLDSLDDAAVKVGREPIPSAVIGLNEFEEAFPSLPGAPESSLENEPDGGALPPVPRVGSEERANELTPPDPPAPEGFTEEAAGAGSDGDEADRADDIRKTSEFQALVAEPPSEEEEALARMADSEELERRFTGELEVVDGIPLPGPEEAFAPTRTPADLARALLPRNEELDSNEEIDVKKTAQFSAMVLADDLSTSIWDFADESIRQRDDGEGDSGAILSGRYRIIEPLATGGMARIYRVRHVNLGKEFALKIIHDDLSTDPQMRKNFIREARVSSLLDHPNIVAVTDFGVDDRYGAYLVLEFLRGETLHDRLSREGRLRLASALDIALQVAEGLHYMHQQNIIHCDIKPENIFLHQPPLEGRRRLQVKLIDFGLSRREALGAQLASSEVGGTPHFMAPEQIRGLAPQPSMDIYSLGVLLYEMIVGDLPFDGSLSEILSAQLHQKPDPPSSRLDEPLDDYVDQLVVKALEKDPEQRQPSMGQMIFEIRTLMEMLGLRSSRRARAGKEQRLSVQGEGALVQERLTVFEHCPCPLFRVDTEPRILVANPAFRQFIGARGDEEVIGRPLDTTRLGQFYPNLRMDILAAALNKTPLQRIISFNKADEHPVSVMIWLVPEVEEGSGDTTFVGAIVPISSTVSR